MIVLVVSATAHAGPSIDSLLCQRSDGRFDKANRSYLSVVQQTGPSVTADDTGKVTVCKDAARRSCATFTAKDKHATYDVNADATLLTASGETALVIEDAATGKRKRTISNKRKGPNGKGKMYSCGGGLWMGDTILALGADCQEFDALPYLASAKTGKFIAPLVDEKFAADGETLYGLAQLDGKRWAIAVYNHNYEAEGPGLGQVFMIDVTTGKVLGKVQGTKAGGADITEGKVTRSIAKAGACPS